MVGKIIYWVSTAMFLAIYLVSTFAYITDTAGAQAGYVAIGYPAYLVPLMMIVKPLGVLAVLVRKPVWLAQLAYAGFFYHLLIAASAHISAGIPGVEIAVALFVLMLLSYFTQNVARAEKAAYVPDWFNRFA
ncbi:MULTISPECIES: DoxX family protein [unclassified Devosia]|uniref:DoxX family protein n=1 Tax=unclassified Devosia TaxID=196773 RepID=UPI00145E8BE6|nr:MULTISPECIES: DoxX family protein [unclassified Devosia]MBJ6986815.1 DoxX family protein [Devosia sp. MC521]MBJ7576744.1 DoxX family protein [Devosia sp. MC532]QMW63850.1 DoxX family protein [Devosia sp. MC521]